MKNGEARPFYPDVVRALLLTFALLGQGCFVGEAVRSVAEDIAKPDPGDTVGVRLEGDWSAADRAQLDLALQDWREVSGGKLNVAIVDDDELAVVATGHTGPEAYTTVDFKARRAVVDVEGLRNDKGSLRVVAAHLVGVMLGMPTHEEPGGVLSQTKPTSDFGALEMGACRDAGFCP